MNVSRALEELEDLLDDDNQENWPLAERVRYLHRHEIGMVRQMAERNTALANYKFTFAKADAVQEHPNRWRYKLPLDLDMIVAVREDRGSTEVRPRPIPAGRLDDPTVNFHLDSRDGLVLNNNVALDLEIDAVKVPARPYRGIINLAFGSAGGIYLERAVSSTASEFAVEDRADAYVNTLFEVTGTDASDGSRIASGQVRRCTSSSTIQAGGSARIGITLESSLDVETASSDTVESIFQIQPKHARLLVLLAARSCFQAKHNTAGIASIADELRAEYNTFINTITPRQKQSPSKVVTSTRTRRFSDDIDSDSTFAYGP